MAVAMCFDGLDVQQRGRPLVLTSERERKGGTNQVVPVIKIRNEHSQSTPVHLMGQVAVPAPGTSSFCR